ncbi:MAG: SWIM zinc finger family protein [Singulisphaera sp.]
MAGAAGLGVETTRSALSSLCQVGRAMFDLAGGVYRHRDLFLGPFSAQEVAQAVKPAASPSHPEEVSAKAIFVEGDIRIIARRPVSTGYKLSGSARGDDGPRVRPLLHADHEGRIIEGSCTCRSYKKHQLTRGPCEHILALRLAHEPTG